ncbi:DUF308 domain-containing protein [Alloprevotella tannerae]|uniref:DUF308 domain-containing protein n=1 Tax=Alloprevotella tannerae TaxID=76122 RepID=UPI0028E4BEB9|nr:DUF308 domain-containing protein [Alloprevotella tannerae]
MKNFLQGRFFRTVCALTLGVLIIIYSEVMPTWLVQAVGVGFLFPGLYAIVSYFFSKRDAAPLPPLLVYTGLGTLLLGLVMFLHPELFVRLIMNIVAVMMMLGGTMQIYALSVARKRGAVVKFLLYILPFLIFCAGLFVLIYYREVASLPFILLGIACILYALQECWLALSLPKADKTLTY